MKKEYNLDSLKFRKNPYASKLKQQITIKISSEVISYFKNLATDTGVPYQNLINSYLSDCAFNNKKLEMKWR